MCSYLNQWVVIVFWRLRLVFSGADELHYVVRMKINKIDDLYLSYKCRLCIRCVAGQRLFTLEALAQFDSHLCKAHPVAR